MASAWPEPVERVSSFLRTAGVEARIQEFPEGTPTAEAAAEAAGCELEQIVKSLVLVCDERPVVALVPGDRRCDPDKVARALEATSARVAKAQEVEDATGFPPGAVAPFPLPKVETVLMDPALYRHSLVWAGAGSDSHMLGIAPSELGRLARARPMDVVQDRT
jgi:prolyl-tRNA editing enzyme YbaK/EbsC (Cys-tRNA(Pro) deacylase)